MAATVHTVVKGECLSVIAAKYKKDYGYTNTYTYMYKLAEINNIKDPYPIYVGQKIKLTGTAAQTTKNTSPKQATVDGIWLQADTDRTVFATWKWDQPNTDRYKTRWAYYTANNKWFMGADNDNTTAGMKQDIYTPPENALAVRFFVMPVAKTHKVNNKDVVYWTANWSEEKVYHFVIRPEAPSSLQPPTIEKRTLTVELDNLDTSSPNGTHIQFQVVKNDGASAYKTSGNLPIVNTHVSYTCIVDDGEYKVRCRAYRAGLYSDWSDFTANVPCNVPTPVSIFNLSSMESGTAVQVQWGVVKNVDSYEIEYATKKYYFDQSNNTTTYPVDNNNLALITGLESGQEYFFRIRSVKGEEKSAWTAIKSIKIGTKPAAPTTWSSSTTVVTGEPLNLYWVHNSEDGSSQTEAELELIIGGKTNTYKITNSTDPDEKDKTSSYSINTSSYTSGTIIKWRVRTKGIIADYSDWSVQRTITVYAQPTLNLYVTKTDNVDGEAVGTLTSFPLFIRGYTRPVGTYQPPYPQNPIGYNLDVVANETYETTDNIGNVKMVKAGETVYSKYIPSTLTGDRILWDRLTASNIDLQNNVRYTIRAVVSMDSGLTAEDEYEFDVRWTDVEYVPNAELSIDPDTLNAVIRPYCVRYNEKYHVVSHDSTAETYTTTEHLLDTNPNGTPVNDVYTLDGYQVYQGYDSGYNRFYYCIIEEETQSLISGVTLAVYRREFDGSFTEIATGLKNSWATYILDPHPALDYARYRIVATTTSTGAVSFNDLPAYPVGESSIVIQWDESHSDFDVDENGNAEDISPWAGSMLKLPYNVDVSENINPDVELIEYIGRTHPVTYYGTQIGSSATWNATIDKEDKETLYTLRRLQRWMGDVYVREPSGSGYWANITVTFNQKHLETTIPVTLNVTRVEGGA